MILVRSLIVLALTVSAYGVARVNSTEELKRLARLPRIELAPPLEFKRQAGFLIFPDLASSSVEIQRLQEQLRERESPALLLQIGRTYDKSDNHGAALRFYTQAIDQFRRKLEVEPSDGLLEAGLGQALTLAGRLEEALPHLQRAVALTPEKAEGWMALGTYHKEIAWAALTEGPRLWSNDDFLDSLQGMVENGADSEALHQAENALTEASAAFDKAVELEDENPRVFLERGIFRAFAATVRRAMEMLVQSGTSNGQSLSTSLTVPGVLQDLHRAAELDDENPARLGLAALLPIFARLSQEHPGDHLIWSLQPPPLSTEHAARISWAITRLQALAESGDPKLAAAAAEMLGCVQLTVFRDSRGGLQSLRAALAADPRRQRASDLIALELSRRGDYSDLVEHCTGRVLTSPSVRNHLFLARAYEQLGEHSRAEWILLTALVSNQNDFFANLGLAALLLKRPDHRSLLDQVKDCLTRAERHIDPDPTPQNQIDLALIKALYFALSDEPATARAILRNAQRHGRNDPDLAAALTAIGY